MSPADLKNPFGPSCCDGGACSDARESAQPCGCDPGAKWVCDRHSRPTLMDAYVIIEELQKEKATLVERMAYLEQEYTELLNDYKERVGLK